MVERGVLGDQERQTTLSLFSKIIILPSVSNTLNATYNTVRHLIEYVLCFWVATMVLCSFYATYVDTWYK